MEWPGRDRQPKHAPRQVFLKQMNSPSIDQHGVIGNMKTAALIAVNGAIDFYCFPDFDSPSVFASLLDPGQGGEFTIEPQLNGLKTRQLYLADTNILLTRFLSPDGLAEITDFMPIIDGSGGRQNQIIRNLRVVKGEIEFHLRCAPRFDYARRTHSIRVDGNCAFFQPEGDDSGMKLLATEPLTIDGQDAVATFTLKRDRTATFVLESTAGDEGNIQALDERGFAQLLSDTTRYWRGWMAKSIYEGRWREMVNRSALILKLLTSQEYGSLIAAPTFGLPERLGGARNWDYRLCWLRDSSFTLYAFMRLGFTEEVEAFGGWMRERIETGLQQNRQDGPLKPMYRIHDEDEQPELTLDHFSGYRDSRPVRIGNAAQDQLQLDVYGELMDSIYLHSKYSTGMPNDGWKRILNLLDWLQHNWDREDEGIWEVRNGPQHFLHSRLMCWVAFDRAIRLARKRSLVAPLVSWLETRDAIHDHIFDQFWNEKLNSFVQSKGSDVLDASVLLMPLMRFISPSDPKWLSTMSAIEENLTVGGLVYRYTSYTDGLDGEEGTFTPCSFWLIECLARCGQVEKAQLLFDKLLGYANHLGLYSEELGSSGEQLGNFPQALTHLALISAASYLDRQLSGKRPQAWM